MIFRISKESIEDSTISVDDLVEAIRKIYAVTTITDMNTGDEYIQVFKPGTKPLEFCMKAIKL